MSNAHAFFTEFVLLDNIIDNFIAILPPIDPCASCATLRDQLLLHTHAHAATIQLHSNLGGVDGPEGSKDIAAAKAAAALLEFAQLSEMTFVDPIMAVSPFSSPDCHAHRT